MRKCSNFTRITAWHNIAITLSSFLEEDHLKWQDKTPVETYVIITKKTISILYIEKEANTRKIRTTTCKPNSSLEQVKCIPNKVPLKREVWHFSLISTDTSCYLLRQHIKLPLTSLLNAKEILEDSLSFTKVELMLFEV